MLFEYSDEITGMLFEYGKLVATNGVLSKISIDDINFAIENHVSGRWGGRWGGLSERDEEDNHIAIMNNKGVVFSTHNSEGIVFWIITDFNESVTTILLPIEY